MVFAKSLDKTKFLYTEHTDNTVCEAFRKMTEKLRPFREIRVQGDLILDFAKAMNSFRGRR